MKKMQKPQREQVREQVKDFDASLFDLLDFKTPAQVIEHLQLIQKKYAGLEVFFKLSTWGYDGGVDLELWKQREQTDEEYDRLLAAYTKEQDRKKKAAKLKKDSEFAEYQRLKKKFEK